jgi:hypothetical protein
MLVLALILACGLSAAGITAIARTLAQDYGKPEWLLAKPLSCDLCMSWWGSVASMGLVVLSESVSPPVAMLAVLGSVGVSLVVVKTASRLSV